MLGVIVNSLVIVGCSIIGLLIKGGIPKRLNKTIMDGLALVIIYMGISGSLKGDNPLYVIISMGIGALIGELIDIDSWLNRFGDFIGSKLSKDDDSTNNNSISKAFVSSSLIFCVGAMAVVGSLQSGLNGDHSTLFAKAVIDGIASIFFSASMGIGVMLSSIAVFIYEGLITLGSTILSGVLSEVVVTYMTSVGSLLILALGFNMLNMSKIKVANLLPSMFIPIFFGIFNII